MNGENEKMHVTAEEEQEQVEAGQTRAARRIQSGKPDSDKTL